MTTSSSAVVNKASRGEADAAAVADAPVSGAAAAPHKITSREPAAQEASLDAATETIILRPRPGWVAVDFRELIRYRELLFFLAMRDIKVRYKQTYLGAAWAIIQPLLSMVVFTIFFGKLAGLDKKMEAGIPYAVFSFCGLLPWQLFAYALTQSGNCLVQNEQLLTKIYFPRLLMPMASVLSGLVDFVIGFGVLLIMMLCYQVHPGWSVVFLPLFVMMSVAAAMAVGLWLSALNVQYRDVRYVIPFLTSIWMFASPVVYPAHIIQNPVWRTLYGLNPMVGVLEGFRWSLLGNGEMHWGVFAVSAAATLLLLVGGLFFFRRMEKSFADVI